MAIKSTEAKARKREYNRQYTRAHADRVNEQQRARYQKRIAENPEYRHGTLAKYGLTQEEYQAMLTAQGGVCAICGGLSTGRRFAVDHDHDPNTGGVRGLLCGRCNTGIGQFKEDLVRLQNAIKYLEHHNKKKGQLNRDLAARCTEWCV